MFQNNIPTMIVQNKSRNAQERSRFSLSAIKLTPFSSKTTKILQVTCWKGYGNSNIVIWNSISKSSAHPNKYSADFPALTLKAISLGFAERMFTVLWWDISFRLQLAGYIQKKSLSYICVTLVNLRRGVLNNLPKTSEGFAISSTNILL